MSSRLGINQLPKPAVALCLLLLLTACGKSSDGPEPDIGEGNVGEENNQNSLSINNANSAGSDSSDSIPIGPALRSRVLDVSARTSELAYKFDLPSPFTFGPGYTGSWDMVPMGDITGDQIDDLVFNVADGPGHARVFPGRTGGWPDSQIANSGLTDLAGTFALPFRFYNLGDLNGDGAEDIVVPGYGGHPGEPHVYVVLDVPGAVEVDGLPPLDGIHAMIVRYPSRLTEGFYGVSDTNGDGLDDFIVNYGYGGQSTPEAFLVLGSTKPFPETLDLSLPNEQVVPIDIEGAGYTIKSLGDINGDSLADFSVSFGYYSSTQSHTIVFGKDWKTQPSITVRQDVAEPGLSYSFKSEADPNHSPWDQVQQQMLSLGDITGDGYDDLFVGWGDTPATLRVLPGHPDIQSGQFALTDLVRNLEWEIPLTIGNLVHDTHSFSQPTEIVPAGDLDGDGVDDIIVYQHTLDSNEGQYYIYYGDRAFSEGPLNLGEATLVSNAQGRPIPIGDVDNDGVNDIGVSHAGYREQRQLSGIFLEESDVTTEPLVVIPPHIPGERSTILENATVYNPDDFYRPSDTRYYSQVIPSPGLLAQNVPEEWTVSVEFPNAVISSELLQPLLEKISNIADLDQSEYYQGYTFDFWSITTTADNELLTIDVEFIDDLVYSAIVIDSNQELFVSLGMQGQFRNCRIDLATAAILEHFYQCRDALTILNERLSHLQ